MGPLTAVVTNLTLPMPAANTVAILTPSPSQRSASDTKSSHSQLPYEFKQSVVNSSSTSMLAIPPNIRTIPVSIIQILENVHANSTLPIRTITQLRDLQVAESTSKAIAEGLLNAAGLVTSTTQGLLIKIS